MRHILAITITLGMVLSTYSQNPFQADTSGSAHPWTHLNFYDNPENFQFAIVTDRTGGLRPGIFAKGVHKLNMLMPEFVMSVGDYIPGVTLNEAKMDAEWAEFDSVLAPLKVPFFFLPGNHDISNSAMRVKWVERYGKAYYHFLYKDVLFIALDSNPEDAVTVNQQQIDYVAKALEENQDARWTLVFMHHPLWKYTGYSGGFDKIEELLQGRDFTVIAGHQHRYLFQERNNANYYTLATTGGGSRLRGPQFGEFDHVTWVTMTDEGPMLANLMLDGILSHDVTQPEDQAMANTITRSSYFSELMMVDDESNMKEATLYLTFQNPSEHPLKVYGKFFHHHKVEVDVPEFNFTISPGQQKQLIRKFSTDKATAVRMLDPVQLDWTMGYEFEDKKDMMASGTREVKLFPSQLSMIKTRMPIFEKPLQVKLEKPEGGYEMHYTTDGSEPTTSSMKYNGVQPINISDNTTLKVKLFNKNGEGSATESFTYEKVKEGTGLEFSYYEGNWRKLPEYASLKPLQEGIINTFNPRAVRVAIDHYAVRYTGDIQIPKTGDYTFYTTSDDGSQVWIDGKLVVDNDGDHGPETKSGTTRLKKGKRKLEIRYFENIGGELLRVEWESGQIERQEIPWTQFSH